MKEILCFTCSTHIAWATDSGPGPIYSCDSCYEDELEKERNDN